MELLCISVEDEDNVCATKDIHEVVPKGSMRKVVVLLGIRPLSILCRSYGNISLSSCDEEMLMLRRILLNKNVLNVNNMYIMTVILKDMHIFDNKTFVMLCLILTYCFDEPQYQSY